MRISDWSSDVCSSDLTPEADRHRHRIDGIAQIDFAQSPRDDPLRLFRPQVNLPVQQQPDLGLAVRDMGYPAGLQQQDAGRHHGEDRASLGRLQRIGDQADRSEEHTSELQSLMRISYAVFCLKKKKK